MVRLSKNHARNLVGRDLHVEGWSPPGADPGKWAEVTVGALGLDDRHVLSGDGTDPNHQSDGFALGSSVSLQ